MFTWQNLLICFFLLGVVAVATLIVVGPAKIWSSVGPADLGPVDFGKLSRQKAPADALACPREFCTAVADFEPPIFKASAPELRATLSKIAEQQPRTVRVDAHDATLTDRYVQRSKLMQYPDTIVVQFIDRPNGTSTVAIYSRSQLGKSDLGVNLARIKLWLSELAKVVPIAN